MLRLSEAPTVDEPMEENDVVLAKLGFEGAAAAVGDNKLGAITE